MLRHQQDEEDRGGGCDVEESSEARSVATARSTLKEGQESLHVKKFNL